MAKQPRLIVMGRPEGYDRFGCNSNDVFEMQKHEDLCGYEYGKKLKLGRMAKEGSEYDIYYNYLIYPDKGKNFGDVNGRPDSYFGISVIFDNQVVKDNEKMFKLLDEVFEKYVKDKYIKEYDNGNKQWKIKKIDKQMAQAIVDGINKIASTRSELNVFNDVVDYTPNTAKYARTWKNPDRC